METKNRKLKIKVEGQPQCDIKAMRQSNEGNSQDSNPELRMAFIVSRNFFRG